jgi:hypothetical protein
MTERSRRHHVVSRFYLRHFANDDRVTTVMLPGDRRFQLGVGDASVRTDYHTVIDPQGQESDAAEQAPLARGSERGDGMA